MYHYSSLKKSSRAALKRIGVFHVGHLAGLIDAYQAGVRDAFGDFARVFGRRQDIVLADDDQCPDADRGQGGETFGALTQAAGAIGNCAS